MITINGSGAEGKEFSVPLAKLCNTKKIINIKIHIEDDFISHDPRMTSQSEIVLNNH